MKYSEEQLDGRYVDDKGVLRCSLCDFEIINPDTEGCCNINCEECPEYDPIEDDYNEDEDDANNKDWLEGDEDFDDLEDIDEVSFEDLDDETLDSLEDVDEEDELDEQ